MNFSDQWRSLFSSTSIFSSPSLMSSSSSIGPLNFLPSFSTRLLSHLPALQIPPPSPSTLSILASFFNSDPSSFLPHSSLSSLAADLLSDSSDSSPISSNNLCVLRSRNDPSNVILFFPSGDNSHSIGFLTLSISDGEKISASKICVQKDGFKHQYHRILKMLVVPATDENVVLEPDCMIEGFLMVSTMYSVSWYRVESREEEGVLVVPMAKQGFERLVVDVKMSPHCSEMSVVLLESGEMCWFEMESRRSGKISICDDEEGVGDWLGCEFGGQPWIVYVACSSGVFSVDLRGKKGMEPKVLVRMGEDGNDRIIAFCRSSFDDLHISVVTEKQLLLFDVRQPLVPVLMWDHGLYNPCYLSMFRLSELRSSENFKWASDSGSVILVGSFFRDEFSMFVYGPREGDASGDPCLYAWELPLSFSLVGRQCTSGDSLVKDSLSISSESRLKKDVVVGFWIIPNNIFKVKSEFGGFALIRFMLSGKLEMQCYHASMDSVGKFNGEGDELPNLEDSYVCSLEKKGKTSWRYYSLDIGHLWEYMNGFSSSKLVSHKPHLTHYAKKFPIDHLKELEDIKLKSSALITTVISDATIPTSVLEITLRRVLNDLELDLLPLAFSKYSFLLQRHCETIIPFLEVPKCLPYQKSIPFFVVNPSRISEKWSKNVPRGEALVGPVFPIPFLLLLQWMDDHLKEPPHGDLLTLQSQSTLDNLYPEISLADNSSSSQMLQNEKSFFIYEKSVLSNTSSCNGFTRKAGSAAKEEDVPKTNNDCLEPEIASKDEKFTTFVCGIADKTYYANSSNEASGFEIFDQLSPYRLDFDSPSVVFQPKEQEMYIRLTRQSSRWLQNYKPHHDFCISSDITKQPC